MGQAYNELHYKIQIWFLRRKKISLPQLYQKGFPLMGNKLIILTIFFWSFGHTIFPEVTLYLLKSLGEIKLLFCYLHYFDDCCFEVCAKVKDFLCVLWNYNFKVCFPSQNSFLVPYVLAKLLFMNPDLSNM